MTNEKIGSFIAAMRKERNMTQEQLAEKLGVSNRSVSRWENGKTLPDLSLMEVICGELGVSMSELLRGEKEAQTMEVKETVVLMASLAHREREKKAREVNQCLIPGFLLLTLVLGFNGIGGAGPGRTILIFAGLGLLLCGESVRGRLMTCYIPEWLERKEIQSVICTARKIVIHTQEHTLTIEGADMLPMAEKLKKVLGV